LELLRSAAFVGKTRESGSPTQGSGTDAESISVRTVGICGDAGPCASAHVRAVEGHLSSAVGAIKLGFNRRLLSENPHFWQHRAEMAHPRRDDGQHFWMRRYYDFNVYSEPKIAEKVHYMHQNPVERGLVERPEQWEWSSFRAYSCGESGIVKVNDWSWWEEKIRSSAVS
jgi:hypothetical protein